MFIKKMEIGLIAALMGLLLASISYASKPEIVRNAYVFDFGPIVECDDFEVWTKGVEWDTEKWWYDEDNNPIKLQYSIHITESEYYNTSNGKFVTQGKNGIGENSTTTFDFTTGNRHRAGAAFRLTIPGIGHVLLNVGTWFREDGTVIHYGPDYAVAEGDTGLALCEALQ